jgi:hypothetical protein
VQVEGPALDGDQRLAHQGLAAIDQPGGLGPVLDGHRRDVRGVVLVGLGQIGGVGVDLEAVAGEPGHRAAGVEAAGEGDADAGSLAGQRTVDATHGEDA